MKMKKFFLSIALTFACTSFAQTYTHITSQPATIGMRSTSSYAICNTSIPQSDMMTPFSDETPSSRNGVRKAPGSGITGGTDGQPTVQQPIGDALFPLLIMASAFAVFTYFRRRRQTTIR